MDPSTTVEVPKSNGKTRPLGMPTWPDKMVQEVIRSILEAYYEPQFSRHSHGFRPKRGCQTALDHIHKNWTGTKWFIEGDIKGCFDNIDHNILMSILRENIQDNRFLRLIEGALKAGYCEEWIYHPSLSGSPQGGIVSPVLSNIYMDRLDRFVQETLIPEYIGSPRRKNNPIYKKRIEGKYYRRHGDIDTGGKNTKEMQQHPSEDPQDPGYKKLQIYPVCRRLCATSAKATERIAGARNCTTDEGWPLGISLQERVPNHLRRLWSKAMVVSTGGKGQERTRSGD